MLSKEMREILVKAFNEIHDADKVAEIFDVSRRTVYTYVEKAREGESLEVRTSERGRKAILRLATRPRGMGWFLTKAQTRKTWRLSKSSSTRPSRRSSHLDGWRAKTRSAGGPDSKFTTRRSRTRIEHLRKGADVNAHQCQKLPDGRILMLLNRLGDGWRLTRNPLRANYGYRSGFFVNMAFIKPRLVLPINVRVRRGGAFAEAHEILKQYTV